MQISNQLSEVELIEAYTNGDNSALEALLSQTQDRVYTSIYILVRDKYLADDLLQDTYIRAFDKLRTGQYLNDGKFTAWLCRIARNLCMDYFRAQKRKVKVTLTDGRDIFDYLGFSDTDTAQEKMMNEQSSSRAKQMLELIPADQREVIVMRLFADMSFKEIAEELNISINTALGRMRYGLLNLRKLVEQKELVL